MPTVGRTEHQAVVLPSGPDGQAALVLSSAVDPKGGDGAVVQVDGSASAVGLGVLDLDDLPFGERQLPAHLEPGPVEVDVSHRSPHSSPRRIPAIDTSRHRAMCQSPAVAARNWRSWAGVQKDISGARDALADGGVASSATFPVISPFCRASERALRMMVCTYRTVRGFSRRCSAGDLKKRVDHSFGVSGIRPPSGE